MSTLFIVDIDATIAHAGRRLQIAGAEPSRDQLDVYNTWLDKVQDANSLLADEPVAGMRDFVTALRKGSLSVVFLTAREEKWRDVTEAWLLKERFPKLPLIMRPNDNFYDSAVFKASEIKELKGLFECDDVVVIDDDQNGTLEGICAFNGWTFLKARSGT
jgi:hypothetical protein